MEKRELSHADGGNVNWCSHCGKEYGVFSKKIKNRGLRGTNKLQVYIVQHGEYSQYFKITINGV